MRIRSIRPEFWTSEDIAAHTWTTRLVYIGLWSYVDDNGVGRDVDRLIAAALFPLDSDAHGALTECSLSIHALCTQGQITRYTVDGKPYLHITAWEKHQKINRPTASRYPLPTCGNAVTHGALSEPSVSPHANVLPGEGEKGRRGEGEKGITRAGKETSPGRNDLGDERGAGPAVPADGWAAIRDVVPANQPHPVRAALALQASALLAGGTTPDDLHAGLEAWLAKPDAGAGLLPHLVGAAVKARTAPARRRSTTDDRVAAVLALGTNPSEQDPFAPKGLT